MGKAEYQVVKWLQSMNQRTSAARGIMEAASESSVEQTQKNISLVAQARDRGHYHTYGIPFPKVIHSHCR
jgi:hypothetical protein